MKRLFIISVVAVLLVSLAIIPCPVSADSPAEVWVDDGWYGLPDGTVVDGHTIGTDAFATILSGINAVVDGGNVTVAAGTYYENITLPVGKNVAVEGAGALATIIVGSGSGTVITANNVGPNTKLDGFTITNGNASLAGGGIYINACSPTITNCIVANNTGPNAAGIFIYLLSLSSKPVISNCLIKNNTATSNGGGIYVAGSGKPTILNCTIVNNTASNGGGIYNASSASSITNTIIYGNSPNNLIKSGTTSPSVNYCCVGGGYPSGTGNTGADPLFVGSGNYHLQTGSPCIDTGNPGFSGPPDLDLDGNLRIHDGDSNGSSIVDMGVYEYGSSPPSPADTQPPTASNPDPSDGSYTADSTPAISVDLSDDQSGVDPATIILTVEGGAVTHSWDGYTVSYTPTVAFANGQVVEVSLDASDIAGNAMPQYSWSFTVSPEYTITTSVDPASSGSVNTDQAGPYHYNDIVELTAVPATGWSFAGWSGDLSGSNNPETIVMDNDKAITATFTQNQYTLTVSASPSGAGSVSVEPSGPYNYGDTVTLTAGANPGYTFTGWSGDLSGTSPATITMDNDKTVTATFTQDMYSLTATAGAGGLITPSETVIVNYGSSQTFTITPNTGYQIADVVVDGSSVGAVSSYTFNNVTSNHTIHASFTSVVFTAVIDINPDTLNLKSQSDKNAITAYIELPTGYDVGQIKVATVKLTVNGKDIAAQLKPTSVGDYDKDGIADLMVKFDRSQVIAALGKTTGDISVTVTGEFNNEQTFAGSCTIKVINPGK